MTPGKPRRRAQQMAPEERRLLLLELAIQAFAEKGIDAAKHADIAKAAGVSVPTVFSYFPTRAALVEAVLSAVGEFYCQLVKHSLEAETPLDRLYLSAADMVEAVQLKPNYVKVWLMWSTHFAPDMQSRFQYFETRVLDMLCEVVSFGDKKKHSRQERQDKARLLLGAGGMLAQLAFRGEKRARQEKFIKNVIDNFSI